MELYLSFFVLLVVILVASVIYKLPSLRAHWTAASTEFNVFQRRFLMVYLLAMGADWMQGAYVYRLYEYYGYSRRDNGILYTVGFASSLLLGTFAGPFADIYGRKTACVMYGIVYILSCITKHFNHFTTLLIGRVLGGIATSLVSSVFESWMVSEHHAHAFPAEYLGSTFSLMTAGNGLVAIASGLIGQWAVMMNGGNPVIAFDISIVLLVACVVLVLRYFNENYGEVSNNVVAQVRDSLRSIQNDQRVLLTGVQQALFEGAMHIFVFLWTPLLAVKNADLPHGLVFACFMLACTLGGLLCSFSAEGTVRVMPIIYLISAATMMIPGVTFISFWLMSAFVWFEGMVGMYWPAIGVLRSLFLPEAHRATVTNLFRVPLNLIVCMALAMQGKETSSMQWASFACMMLHIFAAMAAVSLRQITVDRPGGLEDAEKSPLLPEEPGSMLP